LHALLLDALLSNYHWMYLALDKMLFICAVDCNVLCRRRSAQSLYADWRRHAVWLETGQMSLYILKLKKI